MKIELELHEPYIRVLSKWASVGRTFREAQRHCETVAGQDDAGEAERAQHCLDEIEEILPALEHLHHTARTELWKGQIGYIRDGLDTRIRVWINGDFRHPTPLQVKNMVIGHILKDGRIACTHCALKHEVVAALYPENIAPYSQGCHLCVDPIVQGWDTQLFPKGGQQR